MNRYEYMDRPLEELAEYPIYETTYSRTGKPIVSCIRPVHEAKVLRARARRD